MLPLLMLILNGLQLIIFADFILSWVKPNPQEFPRKLTAPITEPLYAPIRAILDPQKMGGIDISPMIMLLIVRGMQSMVAGS